MDAMSQVFHRMFFFITMGLCDDQAFILSAPCVFGTNPLVMTLASVFGTNPLEITLVLCLVPIPW